MANFETIFLQDRRSIAIAATSQRIHRTSDDRQATGPKMRLRRGRSPAAAHPINHFRFGFEIRYPAALNDNLLIVEEIMSDELKVGEARIGEGTSTQGGPIFEITATEVTLSVLPTDLVLSFGLNKVAGYNELGALLQKQWIGAVHMQPSAAKGLLKALSAAIDHYEEKFGQIAMDDKVEIVSQK